MIKATYTPRSGFSDREHSAIDVTILGFVFGEYEPGYMRSGTKECVLAVIALPDGRIIHAELSMLLYVGASS